MQKKTESDTDCILNNLEKTDPSEKERTYNITKQQTRFYRVCSRDLMECATILTRPSTDF